MLLWFFRSNMGWTEEHDNCLCQEILVLEPKKYKKGSISKGNIREKLQTVWTALSFPDSKTVSVLLEKDTYCWARNLKQSERRSEGKCECHLSGLEKALEEKAAEEIVENDKKKTDNAKAAEMRSRSSRRPKRNTEKAAEWRGEGSETKAKKVVKVEVTELHICAKKMIAFRKGKKENCSCKSNELKLRVNRKIN